MGLIASFIRELAEFESLAHEVTFVESDLTAALFDVNPRAEVLIGELDAQPQGFALFFTTFSTFKGRTGIYLEDLFVRPQARGKGLGRQLLRSVMDCAVHRGCARVEWSVLSWNVEAIAFYERMGAKLQQDWRNMRLSIDS